MKHGSSVVDIYTKYHVPEKDPRKAFLIRRNAVGEVCQSREKNREKIRYVELACSPIYPNSLYRCHVHGVNFLKHRLESRILGY
jgi:hypothetical protein